MSAEQKSKCETYGKEFKKITSSHKKIFEDIVHASVKVED